MFKKLWKKVKKSLGNHPTSRKVEAPRLGPPQPEILNCSKPAKQLVPAAASNHEMASATEAARPVRSAGACPSYAAKSVVGQRMTMEDSWQAVPDLLVVPKWWTCNARDRLPPMMIAPAEGAGDPQPTQQPCQDKGHGAVTMASSAVPIISGETEQPSANSGTAQAVSRPVLDPKLQAEKHGNDPVTVHFFAVYDGHGGPDVAKHCAKSLHEHLKAVVGASVKSDGTSISGPQAPAPAPAPNGPSETGEPAAAGEQQPAEVWPAQLAQNRSAHEVGTTAVVSLVTAQTLWIGNCGDSRALLCREREAVALSLDHKATRVDEVSRVEQAGGYVWWDRVMGELAVSRAIGDHCLRPFVIAEPEITSVLRRPEDQLLIMASDGLWDVFTNEEARALALEKFNGELQRTSSSKMAVKKAASSLAKAALAKGSRDNVTVVVVDMRLHGYKSSHNGTMVHSTSVPVNNTGTPRSGPSQSGSGGLLAPGDHQQQPQRQSPQHIEASPKTPVASDADD
ncbi:hypothetical protein VOLCADRAFT_121292 [Volvox carteri f. nagariensis]|uniref:protein-serine/threonine phosphatase n=1 Tax=Volvox carteri f. nagariensis TaxID=3068 RepID=D8U6Q0_VOLCA|nr:uncharacterized protein VOLCADRAFT_121292 [Volvox carteri f. nagariensis]EFJ44479.1 hypothetical protein VOLCADRAFT_121292 [Volvox carteri f. nagariensis]|eukprot:XP_002954329.1 hypothetical protein VOLCADRAFT_121292 [Volvox carteri f. nagariensis]